MPSEVSARTILHDVTMGDYSDVVNNAQITCAAIGKFCSIAAMTRINPGNPRDALAAGRRANLLIVDDSAPLRPRLVAVISAGKLVHLTDATRLHGTAATSRETVVAA